MNLSDFLDSMTPVERRDFARRCGTTDGYLKQLKCHERGPSAKLCKVFVAESGGKLTLHELRADIWGP